MWFPAEDSVMNRVLVALTTIATILGAATAMRPQTAITCDPGRSRFEQTASPRGVAVEDYLRPRPAQAPTYRPSVHPFDKVMLEVPALKAS
jgi:hypothetical protein